MNKYLDHNAEQSEPHKNIKAKVFITLTKQLVNGVLS